MKVLVVFNVSIMILLAESFSSYAEDNYYWCGDMLEAAPDSVQNSICCCCIYLKEFVLCENGACDSDPAWLQGKGEFFLIMTRGYYGWGDVQECGCNLVGVGYTTQLCVGREFLGSQKPGYHRTWNRNNGKGDHFINLCTFGGIGDSATHMKDPPNQDKCLPEYLYECCCGNAGSGHFQILLNEEDDGITRNARRWVKFGIDDQIGYSMDILCSGQYENTNISRDPNCDGYDDSYHPPTPLFYQNCISKLILQMDRCLDYGADCPSVDHD